MGVTHATVLKLVEGLESKGHHLYCDNYYTSPALFHDLYERDFGACGTVRIDRRGLPTEVKVKLAKGEVKAVGMEQCNMIALKWKDKRPVTMLTMIHDDSMVTKRRRTKLAPG